MNKLSVFINGKKIVSQIVYKVKYMEVQQYEKQTHYAKK